MESSYKTIAGALDVSGKHRNQKSLNKARSKKDSKGTQKTTWESEKTEYRNVRVVVKAALRDAKGMNTVIKKHTSNQRSNFNPQQTRNRE